MAGSTWLKRIPVCLKGALTSELVFRSLREPRLQTSQ
jgi:hypothetical protein